MYFTFEKVVCFTRSKAVEKGLKHDSQSSSFSSGFPIAQLRVKQEQSLDYLWSLQIGKTYMHYNTIVVCLYWLCCRCAELLMWDLICAAKLSL